MRPKALHKCLPRAAGATRIDPPQHHHHRHPVCYEYYYFQFNEKCNFHTPTPLPTPLSHCSKYSTSIQKQMCNSGAQSTSSGKDAEAKDDTKVELITLPCCLPSLPTSLSSLSLSSFSSRCCSHFTILSIFAWLLARALRL